MNIQPSLPEIEALAKTGDFDIAPVRMELLSDWITPIEALRVLKHVSSHCFLLESASYDLRWGRYTFLGYDPKMNLECKDGIFSLDGVRFKCPNPYACIRQVLSSRKSPVLEGFPPFTGGLMGYFGFDSFAYAEPTAFSQTLETGDFNDLDLMLFDRLICFDHYAQKIILIANVDLSRPTTSYNKALNDLCAMKELLERRKFDEPAGGRMSGQLEALFDEDRFCAMVEKAKSHILEGDIFQIVLSNSLSAPFEGSLLQTYRRLRTINPSPYMFYFVSNSLEVAGASPETLVRLENGILRTFPLAGTRPRGAMPQEDEALEEELLADEKELAEHNMLVDLGRNDLGRIARAGSVCVESLYDIERFSHVMHIGSTVRAQIDEQRDALDAIASVLPAGTLSGAPKIRAVQLIGELEGCRRGLYGGAIGYLDFTGGMDMCIAIRIAWKKNGRVFVRSGAGIVADSDPHKEYQECLNKARSSLSALLLAQEDEA